MEVTVAMLLSAICIGICYSAYGIIGNYYSEFRKKNETTDVLLSLRQVLAKDFLKAKLIVKSEDGILLQQDSVSVHYVFGTGQILRKFEGLRADTFKIDWEEKYTSFEGAEILENSNIDLLKFNVNFDHQAKVPLVFSKHYSAHDLFR